MTIDTERVNRRNKDTTEDVEVDKYARNIGAKAHFSQTRNTPMENQHELLVVHQRSW